MKRFFMLLFAVVAFAACEQVYVDVANDMSADDRSLSVSFEDDDTRIQLNEAQKTVWTKGDLVSVFYRSSVNEQWQFDGETGDRVGDIVPVDNSVNPPATHNRVVVVYPYNAGYFLNTETYSIEASLPAVQSYLKDSYGTDGNIMVSSSNYKQVSLKSVCGWLKLQLTGNGEVVKSITFKGNNGEQVAGELHINTSDATCVLASASGDAGDDEVGGTLVRPGTILYDVTLDCGEGVTLGAEPTAFYIALPPQTFENGFKVEIVCADDTKMVKSSSNSLSIERNHIQPMTAMEFTPTVPNNQIWYTSSDGNIVEPWNTTVFGANIISNTYNNGKGIITFDGNVTMVGEYAFGGCTRLTSVNIPDSVTTIGEGAFGGCDSLTSVNIPDSITTIGEGAFLYCTSLTSVNIPDSVTTIGVGAFAGCSKLREFTGKYAADGGRCLIIDNTIIAYAEASGTTYNIPDSVTTIGAEAFECCYSLTSVNIPESVTTIGEGAFKDCTSLTSVNIPNSVTTIGDGAFSYCSSLTSVNIPDSVTTIGEGAFLYCTSLTSVNIPDSVTEIGDGAFRCCTNLREFTGKYAADGGRCLIIDNTIIAYAEASGTTYNIPDSVTTIGDWAFRDCASLTGVNIPDSVTTIGKYAFAWCYSLTSVNIGNSVTTIGEDAFSYCENLTSVDIPDSVTTIGDAAFYLCTSLKSVTIGNSVTTIGEGAFYYCTSLTSVYCKATTPPALGGTSVFDNNGGGRKIYVPAGSVNAYKRATRWSEYASAIVGYNFENGTTKVCIESIEIVKLFDAQEIVALDSSYKNTLSQCECVAIVEMKTNIPTDKIRMWWYEEWMRVEYRDEAFIEDLLIYDYSHNPELMDMYYSSNIQDRFLFAGLAEDEKGNMSEIFYSEPFLMSKDMCNPAEEFFSYVGEASTTALMIRR